MELTDNDLASPIWCDATLRRIDWSASERNLVVDLERGRSMIRVRFTWASNLRIDLDLRLFKSLTWEVSFEKLSETRRRVLFDFAHDGSITLECEAIQVTLLERNDR